MTKLCDTCEYLRYCARSGIEDVGCDRYKKDMTTNEEYLKSCTTEQLAERLASTFDLCGAGCHHCFLANVCLTKAKNGNCLTQEQMIVEWLKQPHSEVADDQTV